MKLPRLGLAISCLILAGSTVSADIIPYGDFQGLDVIYLNVTENNRRNNSIPKFGAPDIDPNSNVLEFDPPDFFASASSSPASDVSDAQINTTIMSNINSTPIQKIIITEGGDYTLTNLGLGTLASVSATVRFLTTHVNGVPLANPIADTVLMTFTPVGSGGDGIYTVPGDSGTAVPWDGYLEYIVPVAGATKVEVVLDNTLRAEAKNGGSAFIAKKDARTTITIPEPAAIVTLLVGACILLAARTRK